MEIVVHGCAETASGDPAVLQNVADAAEASIAWFEVGTGGDAGIVLADPDGRVGSAFNTDLM